MYNSIKRLLDVWLACILLLVSAPLFIILPLLIFIEDSKGSPVFSQERLGKNEQAFVLYKFRSMTIVNHNNDHRLTDTERMLKIGKFIRKTSLDELPQLYNILKGQMSFIGPRPLFVDYLPYYTDKEKKRHCVRPGLSGWAQVNGRNNVSWDDKLSMDTFYVDNISFKLDCIIFFRTVKKVLLGSDVVHDSGQELTQTLIEYREKI